MFALIAFDGDLDLTQHALADLADRRTQNGHGRRGVEVENGLEIVVVEAAFRVETATLQDRVGCADSGSRAKRDSDVIVIIVSEVGFVKDAANVVVFVLPILRDELRDHRIDLLLDAPASVNAVTV